MLRAVLTCAFLLLSLPIGCCDSQNTPSSGPPAGAVVVFSQRGLRLAHGAPRWAAAVNSLTDNVHYYAKLGILAGILAQGGPLELYMSWPHVEGGVAADTVWHRWTQHSNPAISNVVGYEAVDAHPPARPGSARARFAGLRFSDATCLLSGVDATFDNFCVGAAAGANAAAEGPAGSNSTWPGFAASRGDHDESSPVGWTQLWVVAQPKAAAVAAALSHEAARRRSEAAQRLAALLAAPPPREPPPPVTGYDIVVVAGQSNAVGTCEDDGFGAHDDTSGLPVFSLDYGHISWQHGAGNSSGVPWMSRTNASHHHPPTTFREGTDVSSNFSRHYIANGYLAPGRGLLLVNVGKGSTPLMVAQPYSHQMALPPHATLVTSWAPTAECNATVGGLRFAESFDGDSGLRMNAFTHATYHVDAALTVDPATGRNSTPSLRARFPTNRVVAVLWVQGEEDLNAVFPPFERDRVFASTRPSPPVEQYTSCAADIITAWRKRWGDPADPPIPFLGSGFCPYLGGYPTNPIQLMYRKSAGQGRFTQDFTGVPSLAEMLATGNASLGYADTSFDYSGNFSPLECDGAHYTQEGLQLLGQRFAESYAVMRGAGRWRLNGGWGGAGVQHGAAHRFASIEAYPHGVMDATHNIPNLMYAVKN